MCYIQGGFSIFPNIGGVVCCQQDKQWSSQAHNHLTYYQCMELYVTLESANFHRRSDICQPTSRSITQTQIHACIHTGRHLCHAGNFWERLRILAIFPVILYSAFGKSLHT
jgi:hypothetical protein